MAFNKRYILAQEAEERIVSLFRKERNDAADIFNTAIDACQTIILDMYDNAPDVVEVARCKECFYAIPYNEKWTLPKKNNCMWCKRYEDIRTPDWFCADGERRA